MLNKSLNSRFEDLESPGPNSDRLYAEQFQGEQHVETTALLFLSVRIFVGHTFKTLGNTTLMQDFGHACCCQPTVVSGMIESAAQRKCLFMHWNRNLSCTLFFTARYLSKKSHPKKVIFILTYAPKCKRGIDYIYWKKHIPKQKLSMRKTDEPQMNHMNH